MYSRADVKILDCSNSQLIVLNDGNGKIQEGTNKIIQVIDLQKYAEMANEIEKYVMENINIGHLLHLYLLHNISQIYSVIKKFN